MKKRRLSAMSNRTTSRRRRELFKVLGIGCAAAITITACSSSPASTGSVSAAGASGNGTATVNVTYLPILSGAALFVAQDEGFFTKYKIKNVYSQTANPYNDIAALSQGSIDVLLKGSATAWFNAVSSGLKVKDVVDRLSYTCSSDEPFLVSEKAWNAGVRSLADLKGKVVSNFATGSAAAYFLEQALHNQGLSPSIFKQEVQLSYPNAETALKTGAITAGFVANPQASQMIEAGEAHVLFNPYSVVPSGYSAGQFAMSDSFISQDGGSVAVRWVAAYLLGVRYLENPANKSAVISILSKWTGVSASVLSAEYGTNQWIWINPNGTINEQTILSTYGAYAKAAKQVSALPSPGQMYDASLDQRALKMVGTVSATRSCSSVQALG